MKCEVCGASDKERKIRNVKGMCLCSTHITQLYRHGHFLQNTIYDKNEYVLHDDYAEIILRDRHAVEVGRAIIDLDDVAKCQNYKWHIRKGRNTDYVIASLPNNQKVHLHRLVMGYKGDLDVDHLDHNGLNNRKSNLMVKTHADNMRNQHAGRKGIKKVPSGKYQAIITIDGIGKYLGTYDTYEAALQARIDAENNLSA